MKHINEINKIHEIISEFKILDNDIGKAAAQHLDKIINNLSLEVFDKYTANTFFFRLVRIIKLSKLDTQIKLRLLNSLFYILHSRLTLSSQTISTERSYITKKNYFIDAIIYSTITPIFQIPYLSGVYAFLTCYGSDVIGDMTSTLVSVAINDSKSHKNTVSFQKCSTYIKYAILD